MFAFKLSPHSVIAALFWMVQEQKGRPNGSFAIVQRAPPKSGQGNGMATKKSGRPANKASQWQIAAASLQTCY